MKELDLRVQMQDLIKALEADKVIHGKKLTKAQLEEIALCKKIINNIDRKLPEPPIEEEAEDFTEEEVKEAKKSGLFKRLNS